MTDFLLTVLLMLSVVRLIASRRGIARYGGRVILQAMIDITSNYKRTENNIEKSKAYNWVSDMHSDFITVCHLAGYHPMYVKRKMHMLLSSSMQKRA